MQKYRWSNMRKRVKLKPREVLLAIVLTLSAVIAIVASVLGQ